jgi:hypothetical protein
VVKRLHPWGSEWELRLFTPMREHNDVLYATQEEVLLGTVTNGLRAAGSAPSRLEPHFFMKVMSSPFMFMIILSSLNVTVTSSSFCLPSAPGLPPFE